MDVSAPSLSGIDGLSGCMSIFNQLSRIVVKNCLQLGNFAALTGFNVSPTAPGLSAQLRKTDVRHRVLKLLSGGDYRREALLRALIDPRCLVPWTTCSFERSDADLVAKPLLPDMQRLRYCPMCWLEGCHYVTDQLPWNEACPLHRLPFLSACNRCGRPLSMDATRAIVLSPFRCAHCHAMVGGVGGAGAVRHTRELKTLENIARVAEVRAGKKGILASGFVLAIPHPDPGVIDQMCSFAWDTVIGQSTATDRLLSWMDISTSRDQLGRRIEPLRSICSSGDATDVIELAATRIMIDSATSFVDYFYGSSPRRTRVHIQRRDAVSRARMIASQFARRATADAWLEASSLWGEWSGLSMGSAASFVQWMLGGPIRLLGRYSGVQALLRLSDNSVESWGEPGEVIKASRHAGVLRTVEGNRADQRIIGVSDQTLLRACHQILS